MLVNRIYTFIDRYGVEGVYVSFSGGKDSTILLHVVRSIFPDVKAVFLDTWLEYPEIRKFVKGFKNVDIIKPVLNMKDIIDQYGWCFPGKDVAEAIWYARKGKRWAINKLHGLDKNGNPNEFRQQYIKWLPLYESDIPISHFCCIKQKEEPIAIYEKETGRHPILALLASESQRRRESYFRTGCISFDTARPMSKPMSFFTEQDILHYIVEKNIKIASPYGVIYEENQCIGQNSFCMAGKLKCSGEQRTGCMFCPVGCHLNNFAKFKRLKEHNLQLYNYCMEELNEKQLIEWIHKNIYKIMNTK